MKDGNTVPTMRAYRFAGMHEMLEAYQEYFKKLKLPEHLDGFTKELLIQEAYHDIFGVSDLNDPQYLYSVSHFTNADTVGDYGEVGYLISLFRMYEFNKKFGLSLKEFFDLPNTIVQAMINRVKAEADFEKQVREQVDREHARENKKLKI